MRGGPDGLDQAAVVVDELGLKGRICLAGPPGWEVGGHGEPAGGQGGADWRELAAVLVVARRLNWTSSRMTHTSTAYSLARVDRRGEKLGW